MSEMGQFSLSVNPAGVALFGPMVNAEVGLGQHLRFNTHFRFPSLGFFTRVIYSPTESMGGYGVGGGIMGFFGKKGNWGKLCLGLLVEYSKTIAEYYYDPLSSYYTGGSSTNKILVAGLHAGYRFRFRKGFFIHTGMYFFRKFWPDRPDLVFPLPQPDIRFGFEF